MPLAREAWDTLQPIGPLDVRHDRGSAGELFRVSGLRGKKYQAFFAAAPRVTISEVKADFRWVNTSGAMTIPS